MPRTLVRLATVTSVVVGAGLFAMGPAAASADQVAPPPSTTGEADCRVLVTICHPGLHTGWDKHRNVGG
jgi:hypothetical protein